MDSLLQNPAFPHAFRTFGDAVTMFLLREMGVLNPVADATQVEAEGVGMFQGKSF